MGNINSFHVASSYGSKNSFSNTSAGIDHSILPLENIQCQHDKEMALLQLLVENEVQKLCESVEVRNKIREFLMEQADVYSGPPPASFEALQACLRDVHPKTTPSRTCNICCEEYAKNIVVSQLPCGHTFHTTCVLRWLMQNGTCPVCRYELTTNNDPRYLEEGREKRVGSRNDNSRKNRNSRNFNDKLRNETEEGSVSSWGGMEVPL